VYSPSRVYEVLVKISAKTFLGYAPLRFHDAMLATLAAFLIAFAPALSPVASAMPDLKIEVKFTTPNYSAEGRRTTTYIQNDRKRVEERRGRSPQPLLIGRVGPVIYVSASPIVTITRCDLHQVFTLNLGDREYMSMPIPKPPTREELLARALQARQAYEQARQQNPAMPPLPTMPTQPNLLIEIITTDTGERNEMFGFTARHVITTRKQTPLMETDQMMPQENVTDGWYVDLDTSVPCDRPPAGRFGLVTGSVSKKGESPQATFPTFKSIGSQERGFALMTKERFRTAADLTSGRPAEDIETGGSQVIELSTGPLDPALFEVPKNFRKVPQIRRNAVMPYWMQALGWVNYYWDRLKRAM
jgi:hypothetical protein